MRQSREKVRAVALATVFAIGLAASSQINAQIITDGSTGAQVTLNGLDVTIEDSLGTRAGNNLFHSFETFNISSGGSASFTGDSNIQNVISRVTGGEVSNIQGTLRSEVGNADFYFINPAGVTFGEGGSVDVPASFHVSTNDKLRFTDGAVLDTASPTASTLSMAAPEAFGYLGGGSGAIRVIDTNLVIGNGDLGVTGSELLANGGALVGFEQIKMQFSGAVTLENGGSIFNFITDLSDTGGIALSANELLIDGGASGIGSVASSDTTANAGSIEIAITNLTTIQNGSQILSNASAEGNAGDILLTTGQLLIDTQDNELSTGIASTASVGSTGNAGDIVVTVAGMASINNQALIESNTDSAGDAGNIFINANELQIDGQGKRFLTGILSDAAVGSTGQPGSIEVVIAGQANIQSGGVIISRTESEGDSGNVQLTAGDLLIDDGPDTEGFTGIASITTSEATNAGDSGNVTVIVADLASLLGGAEIVSSTLSAGDAGAIVLTANELLIDNQDSEDVTGISSAASTGSTGSAGDIVITIGDLVTIQNGGLVTTSTFSPGVAGTLVLTANELLIDGQGNEFLTGITSTASGSTGNAGAIEITISDLATIQNGGAVTSSTFSEGNAGTVLFSANRLLIDGQGNSGTAIVSTAEPGSVGDAGRVAVVVTEQATIQNEGRISSSTLSEGNGGSVSVESTTGSIELSGGALIVSIATTGNSNSGEVAIVTGGLVTIEDAEVSTQSTGGVAGPVEIRAGTLDTRNAQTTTSTGSPVADGGNVSIETEVFILEETLIQANAVSGNGGTITIDSDAVIPFGNQLETQSIDRLLRDDAAGNVIQAVAESGVSIPPSINAPETDISAALSELKADPGDVPSVASDPCASFTAGSPSSLIESGRGGLPLASATEIELPITTVQGSVAEHQLSLALNEPVDNGNSQTGCRSGV